ncbi:MAG: hypothetical protein ACP5QO_04465 [Clostridia bacterium]
MTTSEPDIATLATLIADRTQVRMLMTPMNGEVLTASVIARTAGVTPQTASVHLQEFDAGSAKAGAIVRWVSGDPRPQPGSNLL